MDQSFKKTLVLKNVDQNLDIGGLYAAFKSFGTITALKLTSLVSNKETTYLAFVSYATPEEAAKAFDNKQNITINDEPIDMEFAKSRRRFPDERRDFPSKPGFSKTKLHVSGLPVGFSERDLCDLLGDCKIYYKENRTFAFADYMTESKMSEAVLRLNRKKNR
ncbi:hypothetical protein EDEG_03227 [Edhazardia aedis USNM 41457]|uniref:RRM domain-containing protein n=1 Tax=Edhazardia aedis (strain USNM 41457) TaxID=1003232 RepID=J9DI72_EDHAE|nr:hypothetical protein EDEG_03227 [Edhazardia aedis USNM 41457]|eukprot:EJW02325.1 hypothetical protein EDEG_03227 [Edhazardia aedis USNM 41457]